MILSKEQLRTLIRMHCDADPKTATEVRLKLEMLGYTIDSAISDLKRFQTTIDWFYNECQRLEKSNDSSSALDMWEKVQSSPIVKRYSLQVK